MAGRSGMPIGVACCNGTAAEAVNTCVVIRAAIRLATPGRAFASWMTIGMCRRLAAT